MRISESFEFEEVIGLRFGRRPFGRPKMLVYLYYIDGLLIDTGQSKLQSEILKSTQDLNIEQIFLTHHHEDHSGNIGALKAYHNCKVYAPTECCSLMTNPPKLSLAQKLIWGDREGSNSLIAKDDFIETNKYRFELIPIPGHAPDMVALFEPNKKWLFSSDLYINSFIGYMLDTESIATQINSLKKVLALDFEVMFCSHNPKLRHGKHQLEKKLLFLEDFYDQVSSLHIQGYSESQIFKELQLKENWLIKMLSSGKLSKLNMVKSVIRDEETKN